jgi:hypothetical protein
MGARPKAMSTPRSRGEGPLGVKNLTEAAEDPQPTRSDWGAVGRWSGHMCTWTVCYWRLGPQTLTAATTVASDSFPHFLGPSSLNGLGHSSFPRGAGGSSRDLLLLPRKSRGRELDCPRLVKAGAGARVGSL